MRWAFYGVAMIAFDRSNLIWHARILPAHYPSPFICTGCAIRSLRHFKKNFLAFFIAVSPFSLSAAEIVQGDHAVATGGNGTTEAKGKDTVAIGNYSSERGVNSLSVGASSAVAKDSVAVGNRAYCKW
jgi:hypothetical protein